MLTLPQDFLGTGYEMLLCSRFQQVMAWKTKPGGCSGHWWPAAVLARVCDGLDPLSLLRVPNPPSHPLEGLCAGDEGGTEPCRCHLQWHMPRARLFCCGYTHVHACACMRVHAACAATELELRRRHEADFKPVRVALARRGTWWCQ